jgi:hypothetical protein
MIQRVQTLFLLGIVICMALTFIFPIWEKLITEDGLRYMLDAFQWSEYREARSAETGWTLLSSKPTFYLAGLAALSCLVALYSIFQFKARLKQMKLGAVNAFVLLAYVALATYFIYTGEEQIGHEVRGVFKPGYFLPLGALLFNSLANRFIRKDEKLVRSVDRIR